MSAIASEPWHMANQRYLAAELARLAGVLRQYYTRLAGEPGDAASDPLEAAQAIAAAMPAPPALETLCATFGLSPFERDLLLLCAGAELDGAFAALLAAAHADGQQRAEPTFGLALAALPGAHWSALAPTAPLRRWQLIDVDAGNGLTRSPLRINERVLHYLAGISQLDERLAGVVEPAGASADLAGSHASVAEQVAAAWARAVAEQAALPAIQLCGGERAGKRAIAAAACAALGLEAYVLAAQALPTSPVELESFARLWEREAALGDFALLLDCDELEASDAARAYAVDRLIQRVRGIMVVLVRERRRMAGRATIAFVVRKPEPAEQHAAWRGVLGPAAERLNGQIERLVEQFSLGLQSIHAASASALGSAAGAGAEDLGQALWDACRAEARPRLDDLAQRIEPAATWDDLVLPEPQRQILRDIAAHVRQRAKVYKQWGFAAQGARGLGISALFAGASGAGKTMAAEVLAHELRLDLYRIDLSAVVSKYIGETEKNLRQLFDVAEDAGAIMLFDEADALFGKRSEVKDSHDRYANIEVSYLLQRMEQYRGLAILTTNLKNALDTAFLRRIRFVVQFPFPDPAQRAEIWRRIFPLATPTEGLAVERLAQLNVAGGNIRNIALNAAFLAADAGEPVQMRHLLRAARGEYAKLEKTLTEAEVAGWV